MVTFRAPRYDDKEYDHCSNMTFGVLEVDQITIPLCEECINDLFRDIDQYRNIVFCKDCAKWHVSQDGISYGGTCEVSLKESGKDISELKQRDYGYICCKGCMDTCKDAVKR